jgi:hypothetical protein
MADRCLESTPRAETNASTRHNAAVTAEADAGSGASPLAEAKRALASALELARPGVERDAKGYVVRLEDNLLPGITRKEIEDAFGAGAGQELAGKMRAPWSSSALAVNSFAPWQADLRGLTVAGISGFRGTLKFEAQCPNGVSAIPPHLDVLLEGGDGVVGIESKCTEHLSAKAKVAVSGRYLKLAQQGDVRASSQWFGALAHVENFRLLDAYQLVKHYLGLSLEFRGRPLTLVYLYWEPANAAAIPLFGAHRAEIERFAELVADDPTCRFESQSYAEHWAELDAMSERPRWLADHLGNLRRRYSVEI